MRQVVGRVWGKNGVAHKTLAVDGCAVYKLYSRQVTLSPFDFLRNNADVSIFSFVCFYYYFIYLFFG